MIGDIMQPTHLLFVLVIALLVLGPKRLPEVGRQLGNGIRDFRAAINGERTEHPDEVPTAPAAAEQVHPPTPVEEHQFAHEAVDRLPEEHEFAHVAAQPAQTEHQFAHAPAEPPAPGGGTEHSSAETTVTDASPSASEHEFAYEPSQPAEKPGEQLG